MPGFATIPSQSSVFILISNPGLVSAMLRAMEVNRKPLSNCKPTLSLTKLIIPICFGNRKLLRILRRTIYGLQRFE